MYLIRPATLIIQESQILMFPYRCFSGETNTDIILPEWQIPAGYRIASVTGPDGQTYAGLEEALNAHPTFTVSNNDFQVFVGCN